MLAAALGVFGTGTAWPDIAVAAILAALGVSGGWQIIRQACGELAPSRCGERPDFCPCAARPLVRDWIRRAAPPDLCRLLA